MRGNIRNENEKSSIISIGLSINILSSLNESGGKIWKFIHAEIKNFQVCANEVCFVNFVNCMFFYPPSLAKFQTSINNVHFPPIGDFSIKFYTQKTARSILPKLVQIF